MAPTEQPILFLWAMSPWASKVVHYMALRGIPYTQCIQPITMPRPDIAALGVQYRRIPVLALGRDIYCDSLLILQKLEEWYNDGDGQYPSLRAKDPTGRAMEKLLEKWTDVVVFGPAAGAIPSEMDLLKDPAFQKDREELWGRPWTAEEQDKLKPAALANLRANFDFLEDLLSDGRGWILGNMGPGLADIHAAWIFMWMLSLPNAMPESFFSAERYPRTRAWLSRYENAINRAKQFATQPTELEGPAAIEKTLKSPLNTSADTAGAKLTVVKDPSGLKQGQEIEMYPIDTGSTRRDRGRLVHLTSDEVAVSAKSEKGDTDVRIHYPRWNFSIAPASKANGV